MSIDPDTASAVRDLRVAALVALGRSEEAAQLPELTRSLEGEWDIDALIAEIYADEPWLADLASGSRARAGQALARTAHFVMPALEELGYSPDGSIEADVDLVKRTASVTVVLDPKNSSAPVVDVSVRTPAGFMRGARASKDGIVVLPDVPLTTQSPNDWTVRFDAPKHRGPRSEETGPNLTDDST